MLFQDMNLFVFAHRGEAQSFLDNDGYKAITNELYQNDKSLLLITGEGMFEVMIKLTKILENYKINEIINLGVCGALQDIKQDIYSIRTVYGQEQFKSFTSNDPQAMTDIITSQDRALTKQDKEKLSPFAQLVDRELWAIAYVANKYKIPFRAYKLISDNVNETDFCDRVKERASLYSQDLYNKDRQVNLPNGFYFTRQQEIQFHDLKTKCAALNIDIDILIGQAMIEKLPKKRTSLLISLMRHALNPMKSDVEKKFKKLTKPFTTIGAKVSSPDNLESHVIDLRFQIKNELDLNRLKLSLELFNLKKYQDFIDGDMNV
jgi:nucleoside phosphorylase